MQGHIYEFLSFTSGSRRSGNSVRIYCENASNDKKSYDFGSFQRVSKKSLVNSWQSFPVILQYEQKNLHHFKEKKKWSNPEISVLDIRKMFRRQIESDQRNERKDNNKVILIN